MAHRNLGRMMENRGPADDPSTEFETQPTLGQNFYSYDKLTPERMERIFRLADNRGRVDMLYRLYDDMEHTDLRYSGILNQLRSTIAQMPIRVVKSEGRTEREKKIAEEYKDYGTEVMRGLDTHSLVQEMVEPYIRGAALYKLDWEMQDLPFNRSMWFPSSVEVVDGKHLKEETDSTNDRFGELKVRTQKNPTGTFISDLPFDNHLFLERRQGTGRYSRIGVARKITPWYLALRYIQTWWVQFIENYGQPLRVGKYPRASKRADRKKMKQFLRKLGQDGYGLFPSGMEIEMVDVNQSGRIQVHKSFIELAHREYSIALLGQAGTTGEGDGGYAKTVELNGIRFDIIQNIGKIIQKGLTKTIRKGLRLNYGDEFRPHLVPDAKPILLNSRNAKQRAKAAQTVSKMGVPVPLAHVYENILGTEKPEQGENVVAGGEIVEVDGSLTEMPNALRTQNNASESNSESSNSGDNSVANSAEQDDGTVD